MEPLALDLLKDFDEYDVIKNNNGEIIELHCTYDPNSKGGWTDDGRKVKGTLHWVSVKHAIDAEVRLYDRLFNLENPLNSKEINNFTDAINSASLSTLTNCKIEPSLSNINLGIYYQFLRTGYFCFDSSSAKNKLIFNRTSTLRDSWKKT